MLKLKKIKGLGLCKHQNIEVDNNGSNYYYNINKQRIYNLLNLVKRKLK